MVTTLLHAVAGAVLAAWAGLHIGLGSGVAAAAAVLVAALAFAALGRSLALRALPRQSGRLRWDGAQWCWVGLSAVPLARVVLSVDLGLWVLLRLHPATGGPVLWRCASAAAAGPAWHGLRLAWAAHAGGPAVDGAAGEGAR